MLACWSMVIGIGGLAGLAAGQNALYEPASSESQQELLQWGKLYLQARSGSVQLEAKVFAFKDPAMNSPLFSPVFAAARTASANVTLPQKCQTASEAAVATYLSASELTTSLDDAKFQQHLAAYVEALNTTDVRGWITDGRFTTVGLPSEVAGDLKVTTGVVAVNPTRVGELESLAAYARDAAGAIDQSTAVRDELLGAPTIGQRFTDSMRGYLLAKHGGESVRARELALVFGRYGRLPVVQVAFDLEGQYVLVDALNGSVFGPFKTGEAFNGSGLLASRAESASTSFGSFVDPVTGCPIVADTRTPWIPAGPGGPALPLPPGLTPVAPAPGSPLLPGKPSPWKCTTSPVGICRCETTYNYWGPCAPGPTYPPNVVPVPGTTGCLYKLDIVCTGAGLGPCTNSPNTTPAPGGVYPAPTAPGGATAPPAVCTYDWWYWS